MLYRQIVGLLDDKLPISKCWLVDHYSGTLAPEHVSGAETEQSGPKLVWSGAGAAERERSPTAER